MKHSIDSIETVELQWSMIFEDIRQLDDSMATKLIEYATVGAEELVSDDGIALGDAVYLAAELYGVKHRQQDVWEAVVEDSDKETEKSTSGGAFR